MTVDKGQNQKQEKLKLTVIFSIMMGINPHSKTKDSNPSPGALLVGSLLLTFWKSQANNYRTEHYGSSIPLIPDLLCILRRKINHISQ
jgi:hypothetical protein